VLRYLGLRQAGGTQSHITRRVRLFEIDTSHFTGLYPNCHTLTSTYCVPRGAVAQSAEAHRLGR
jgi:allantoicase